MTLQGKTALIAGGAGGIGSAIAGELLAAGADVMLADRDEAGLERRAQALAGEGRVVYRQADLTDTEQLQALRHWAIDWNGGLDILVNALGVNHFGLFVEQPDRLMEQTLHINVLAPIRLCRVLLPDLMLRPAAAILNIGSVFGTIGYPGYAAYSASKFALRGFTEALRRELADSTVRCHYLAPRATRTGINSAAVDQMNAELGNAVDDPAVVAVAARRMLERDYGFAVVGWPEKLFARLNGILPSVVERAIARQLPLIRKFAHAAASQNNDGDATTPDHTLLRRQPS